MTPEAYEVTREPATALGQRVRREGRLFTIPAVLAPPARYRRSGRDHHVAWALDGALICDCEAAALGHRECWAIPLVRKEIEMTVEERNETALVPVKLQPPQALVPSEREIRNIEWAARLALNGMVSLPKELDTPDKVCAVMLYGYELGLRPMTAIQELFIINGRVQPSARIMAGLLAARSDAVLKVVESTDKKCTMRLIWPSRQLDETWTVEWPEIEKAKLDKRETWQSYPRDKLITHCTKRILRVYAPDIINGLTGPVISRDAEAAEDEDRDDVIDAELYNPGELPPQPSTYEHGEAQAQMGGPSEASPAPDASPPPPSDPVRDYLTELEARHGKTAVTEAGKAGARLFPHAAPEGRLKLGALSADERRELVEVLRVRLERPNHEHELAYSSGGLPLCRLCGDEMGEPAPANQQALI